MRKRSSNSVSLDSVLQEDLLYDWIVETEKQALQEDEVPLEHVVSLRTYLMVFFSVTSACECFSWVENLKGIFIYSV